jgi:hypothetical protein
MLCGLLHPFKSVSNIYPKPWPPSEIIHWFIYLCFEIWSSLMTIKSFEVWRRAGWWYKFSNLLQGTNFLGFQGYIKILYFFYAKLSICLIFQASKNLFALPIYCINKNNNLIIHIFIAVWRYAADDDFTRIYRAINFFELIYLPKRNLYLHATLCTTAVCSRVLYIVGDSKLVSEAHSTFKYTCLTLCSINLKYVFHLCYYVNDFRCTTCIPTFWMADVRYNCRVLMGNMYL